MADERTARADLVKRLSATVGGAKALSAVDAAAAALGLTEPTLDAAQRLRLLDHLGAGSDIVAIASRLLKAQLMLEATSSRGATPVPR